MLIQHTDQSTYIADYHNIMKLSQLIHIKSFTIACTKNSQLSKGRLLSFKGDNSIKYY